MYYFWHSCMLCWKKTAWNLEKSMHVLAFHTQPHQSKKPPTQFTTQPFFSPISLNSISLRSVSLIYKRERRKKNFWFQYINCSPGDPVFFSFFFFLISNPLKCEATSQKHGGLLREGEKHYCGGLSPQQRWTRRQQLLNQMLVKYKNQQLYSKATLHIAKTATKLSKNCLENAGALIPMFEAWLTAHCTLPCIQCWRT